MKNLLAPDTKQVIARISTLKPKRGVSVIVASMPRTGTHLAIDLILNNFRQFQSNPLFVNFNYIQKADFSKMFPLVCHGHLMKTHFPYLQASGADSIFFDKLMSEGDVKVICLERNLEDALRSHNDLYDSSLGMSEYEKLSVQYRRYWNKYDPLHLRFEDLILPHKYEEVVGKVAGHIGVKALPYVKLPIKKEARITSLFFKGLTRVLGKYSCYISTGVRLSKIKHTK